MRSIIVSIFAVALLSAAPVWAGTVAYENGVGSWRPTSCQVPQPPALVAPDSEAAADSLNARLDLHNRYAVLAESFMKCVSDEAARDENAVNNVISLSAKELIEGVYRQTSAEAAALEQERLAHQR
jgi:hypothetical protein